MIKKGKETFLNYVTSDGMKKTIRIKPELLNHEDLVTLNLIFIV